MTRRDLLSRLIQGGSLVVAGIVAVPAAVSALSPLFERRRSEHWQPLGSLDNFPEGEMRRVFVDVPRSRDPARSTGQKDVFVWHSPGGNILVLSRRCTDLGCGVIWDAGSQWFFCPCHGGIFATNGERQAGPPQRDMYRYATRVRDDVLEIDMYSLPPHV